MNLEATDHIYSSAYKLYNNNLAYHNFDHVIDTLANAGKILKECDSKNITYDKKVICHAILFHDARYDVECLKEGFDTKESHSAYLAESVLANHGESEEHIEKVTQAILCTHMDAVCSSNNDMIVRAADLLGLTAPYKEFKSKAIDLYKERELLSGEKIAWEQYKDEVSNILHNFLKSSIELDIDLFTNGNYMFHTKVFHNLDTFMEDTID